MHKRTVVRAGSATLAAAALAITLPTIASAHVTIRPDNDESGSWSKVTVRVPNESDTAGTVAVRLELPADAPFASVRVQPRPGWTAEVTREQLAEPVTVGDVTLDEAVTSVTWTAAADTRIGPDEFDEFAVSLGPLPEAGTYEFPATQTYDDGTEVAWAEPTTDGAEEPEHPAPALTVVEAASDAAGAEDDAPDGDAVAEVSPADSDGLARGVAAGGIVVGAAGIGIGAAALRRTR